MKTVKEWVDKILSDSNELIHWLTRQYIGERLAAERLQTLVKTIEDTSTPEQKTILGKIAKDELTHSDWVATLLTNRGIELPQPTYEHDKYWKLALSEDFSSEEIFAAGAHAENMRLHRIRAIVADTRFDEDIREVFSKILPDEEFHAKAFAFLAGKDAIESTRSNHELGLKALGLEI